jgi:hypothetical protein
VVKYVVYKQDGDREDARYWSGGFLPSGKPTETDGMESAVRFAAAREAYDAAGQYKTLQKWRVGARAG